MNENRLQRTVRFAFSGRLGWRSALAGLGDALFPPVCAVCRRCATSRADAVCGGCWPSLRFIEPPFCAVLGTPFASDPGEGAVSPQAIADPPPFSRMRSALVYDHTAGRLASSLKYGDRMDLVPMMAGWMVRAAGDLLAEADMIVPVPLHRWRLLARRFNQSGELARRIAREAGRPFRPLVLERRRPTQRQVGLGATQRHENVRGAFAVPEGRRADIAGRRVLLVDDVYTTGATVEAATRALRRGGAGSVDVLVFARVAGGD